MLNSQETEPKVKKLGQIKNKKLLECSGIARSNVFEKHFWVHNDSGASATLFLLDQSGKTKSEVLLEGVRNRDFEDIVSFRIDDKNYIAVGDIGDNLRRYKELRVHVIEEPGERELQDKLSVRPLTSLTFRFEDNVARDCEALAFLPNSCQLLVCSKPRASEVLGGKMAELFSIDFKIELGTQQCVAKKIGKVAGGLITGMDCSSDGKKLVVRNYLYAHVWSLNDRESLKSLTTAKAVKVNMPLQRQSEAICFSKGGQSLITTSEGKFQDLFEIHIE